MGRAQWYKFYEELKHQNRTDNRECGGSGYEGSTKKRKDEVFTA